MNQEIASRHYERLAKQYDDFLYYSPEFVRCLTSKMIEKLQLQPSDLFVDIGCGTGIYTKDILKQVPLQKPVFGVEPSDAMRLKIPQELNIRSIGADALEFSCREEKYDKVLMKEVIHHVDDKLRLFQICISA